MSARGRSSPSPPSSSTPPTAPKPGERRRNRTLREVLEELLGLVREVNRNGRSMSREELEYAQRRLEWLADEAWAAAVQGEEGENVQR